MGIFILMGFLCWALFKFNRPSKETLFSFLWILFTLLPVLNIVPTPWPSVWDRFLYLPSVGLSIWVGWFVYGVITHARVRQKGIQAWLWGITGFIFLVIFAGMTLDRNKDWRDNLTLWSKTLEKQPVGASSWAISGNNLAEAYMQRGEIEDAVQLLEKIHTLRPSFFAAGMNLGNAYAAMGNSKRALQVYNGLLSQSYPVLVNSEQEENKLLTGKAETYRSAKLFYNLGVLYREMGEFEKAGEAFQQSLSLNPKNHFAYHGLGKIYLKKKAYHKAEEALRAAVRIKPDFVKGYNVLGQVHVHLGEIEKAREVYETAMNIRPENKYLIQNLGGVYILLGEFQIAAEIFQRGVQLFPENASLHYNLGLSYQRLGELNLAKAEYQKAIDLDPQNPEIYNNMGTISELEGESLKALRWYQEAVNLRSDYIRAQINVGRMYIKMDQYRKGASHYQSVLKEYQGVLEGRPEKDYIVEQLQTLGVSPEQPFLTKK